MKIDLGGRVALVTGSTRGIGREIAGVLAECGARVAVTGRDQGKADEVARALGGDARGFACDVGDPVRVTALIDDVERGFGALDILVNNAGLTRDNVIMRLKDEDWDTAELQEAAATLNSILDLNRIQLVPNQNALILRGTTDWAATR